MPRETLVALAVAVRAYLQTHTQEELAEALGCTQSNLSQRLGKLERGEAVTWDTAEQLARAIGYELVLVKAAGPQKYRAGDG